MPVQYESKVIGNFTYTVEQLGALKGRAVFVRLVRLLGASVDSMKADANTILAKAAGSFTEEDMSFFCDEFAKKTRVTLPDNREPLLTDIFDAHFAGAYADMVQWLIFAFKVNFGSFFIVAGAKAAEKGQPASGSPIAQAQPKTA
jgi:hypothetical protein